MIIDGQGADAFLVVAKARGDEIALFWIDASAKS